VAAPVIDPVCGMSVEPASAAASTEIDGVTYHFCSSGCHDAFVAEPNRYTARDRVHAHH
jgi:YHS domain-containing protein